MANNLSINEWNEGGCYKNTGQWRDTILFNITVDMYELFISTDRIRLADKIQAEFVKAKIGSTKRLNLEMNLIGTLKIISVLENYFKLILLNKNYIIHIIDRNVSKDLATKQKKEPVPLQEIFAFENAPQPVPDVYFFSSLSKDLTIPISWILNSQKYFCLMGLDEDDRKFILELNDQRNFLHFLTSKNYVDSNPINLYYIKFKDKLIKELIKLNDEYGVKLRLGEAAFIRNRLEFIMPNKGFSRLKFKIKYYFQGVKYNYLMRRQLKKHGIN